MLEDESGKVKLRNILKGLEHVGGFLVSTLAWEWVVGVSK